MNITEKKYNLFELIEANSKFVQTGLLATSPSMGRVESCNEAVNAIRGAFVEAASESCGKASTRTAAYIGGVTLCLAAEYFCSGASFAPLFYGAGAIATLSAFSNLGISIGRAELITRQYNEDYKLKPDAIGNSEVYKKAEIMIGNYVRKKSNAPSPV